MKQAQPYRKASSRRHSAALRSMQKGSGAYMRNPMDAKRALAKQSRRKKRRRASKPHPLAAVLRVRRGG